MGQYHVRPAADTLTDRYFAAEPETPELDAVHAENQANARLIAKAPELLELAMDLLDTLDERDKESSDDDSDRATTLDLEAFDELVERLKTARALVAEIGGSEHP